jgi:hypothetical protein
MIRKNRVTQTKCTQQQRKTWVTLTFHSPSLYKVTNLFKRTILNIAFRATNTIHQQLSQKHNNNNPSVIYRLEWITCNMVYVRQSGRLISVRHKEQIWYIRNNNPTLPYAMHVTHNRHEICPAGSTLQLLKHCYNGTKMNIWESLYIHAHHKQTLLISEKQTVERNPYLYWHAHHVTHKTALRAVSLWQAYDTHTHTHTRTHTHNHTHTW